MNKETHLFNPTDLELSRSTFDFHPTVSGTAMAGRLYPAFAFEVLPGDSIKMDLNTLIKMSTPVYPTMDRLYMDVAFFFVPNRLILGRRYGTPAVDDENTSWKAFIGAQDNLLNCPLPQDGVTLPKMFVNDEWITGSIGDCLGYPHNFANYDVALVNALEVLSYVAIFNENFRDPNTSEPVTWSFAVDGDSGATVVSLNGYVPTLVNKAERPSIVGSNYAVDNALKIGQTGPVNDATTPCTMIPFATCRFHGYFGSVLPWPQRNSVGVELPLGDKAPVYSGSSINSKPTGGWIGVSLGEVSSGNVQYPSGANLYVDSVTGSNVSGLMTDGQGSATPGSQPVQMTFTNLYTDLSQATAANINALRLAVQKQRWYEKLARSGNRFDELEYGLFGVRPHDSGEDRPLYLGGKRIPLNIEMVASTNGGTSGSSGEGAGSLGALGAFSHTNDSDHYFYHSFDEWGTLMCVFTIRHHTTVSNRLKRSLTRESKFDFYWPTFAHLGEQAILQKELYAASTSPNQVFGYQEAWAEYRYEPDVVTGLLRPGKNLDFMTYAEEMFNSPTYTVMNPAEFLNASYQMKSVDKTLAVASYSSGFQFVYQFNFDFTARRCMPQYSIPGLVDHF